MTRRMKFAALFIIAFAVGGCGTQLRQASSPESVGLSSEHLKALSSSIESGMSKKEIPGAVVLLVRHGQVGFFEAFGYRDLESGAPMSRDAIFRIASMTKPITIVAAMTLVEQGRLELSDPVSKYLPEFKDVKVGVEKKDASGKPMLILETPHREMTVLDLMRHTSGLTYDFLGKSLVKDQYAVQKLRDAVSNADFVTRISRAPLQNHPGEVWDYSFSTDVLGRVIEVVSGVELGQYMAEQIFKPLEMVDTGFWVSDPSKHSRIAEAHPDPKTGKRPPLPNKTKSGWQSGGGGLVSTASDYARFCQMLLNGGELDGVRIISRNSTQAMTRSQLPPTVKMLNLKNPALDARPEVGNGFGLNLLVRTADEGPLPGNVGDYSWPGIFGTQFWVDPKKDLVVVIMMQVPGGASELRSKYWPQNRELVYRALMN
jgi:CubicO group peptidase (beta-lactamase class C family)